MEVTTVSPSPASPSEEDDLCETDVTNVAIHSVTLLICLCGLAGNGVIIRLFRLENRNSAIFHLAVADFLFLLFMVPSALLFLVEDVSCSLIVPLGYMTLLFYLSVWNYLGGLYRLTCIRSAVIMSNLWELCCCCQLPECLWVMVCAVQCLVIVALPIVIPMMTSLCPSHEQEPCRAALISMYVIILLPLAAPVLISHTIDIIKAQCSSKKQQPKRQDIFVFIIVLFTLLLGICNFLQQLGYTPMSTEVVFLLTCIHCSIKPYIYFMVKRCSSPCSMVCLQISLQRVSEEPKENTACRDYANTDTML